MNAKTTIVKLSCDSLGCVQREFEVSHAERLLAIPNNGGWYLDDKDYELKDGDIIRRVKKKTN